MVSQEIAKAQTATLLHLMERLSDTIVQSIKEELDKKLAGKIQDVEGSFDTSKCPKESLVKFLVNHLHDHAKECWNYTLAAKGHDVAMSVSWSEFKESFLQKVSPEAELKNIHLDFLTKDWKNMDELMNAALEREQETKKKERSPLKRKIEHDGPSNKRLNPSGSYPRSGGKGYL
ncbi:hypothetical protein Tco_0073418 [Tanacetum coccineum]